MSDLRQFEKKIFYFNWFFQGRSPASESHSYDESHNIVNIVTISFARSGTLGTDQERQDDGRTMRDEQRRGCIDVSTAAVTGKRLLATGMDDAAIVT